MRCVHCDIEIPDDSRYCPKCQRPVDQMMPDVDSLESLLASEVNDMLGTPLPKKPDIEEIDPDDLPRPQASRRLQSAKEKESAKREERIRQRRKKQIMRIVTLALFILVAVLAGILIHSFRDNTYSAQIKKADKKFAAASYEEALEAYENAAELNAQSPEAYLGIGQCKILLGDEAGAEEAFLKVKALKPNDPQAYQLLASLYEKQGRTDAITALLAETDSDAVLSALREYIPDVPAITPAPGHFDDKVEVTLSAASGTIHYTTDNTAPTAESPAYAGPIVLDKDGNYVIRAVCVNDKGIIGEEVRGEFIVEIPLMSGPSVSPASGVYTEDMMITVDVPSGTTVYYTLDGSTPTKNSTVYTGPIPMPDGQSTFSCISVGDDDRESSVIKRQYNLISVE